MKDLREKLRTSGDEWLARIANQLNDHQLDRLVEIVKSGIGDELRKDWPKSR